MPKALALPLALGYNIDTMTAKLQLSPKPSALCLPDNSSLWLDDRYSLSTKRKSVSPRLLLLPYTS